MSSVWNMIVENFNKLPIGKLFKVSDLSDDYYANATFYNYVKLIRKFGCMTNKSDGGFFYKNGYYIKTENFPENLTYNKTLKLVYDPNFERIRKLNKIINNY